MFKYIFLLLAFVLVTGLHTHAHAQTYTVQITVTDLWYDSNKESFRAYLRADIYRDGELIPPSNNYYYDWYVYYSFEGYWKHSPTSGFGVDIFRPETLVGYYILSYVVVTDSVNHTFENIQSDITNNLRMDYMGKAVDFQAYSENGGNISFYVTPEHWRYTINQWRDGYYGFLTKDYTERLKAAPNYLTSLGKKFQYWNNNSSDIIHYNSFYIDNTTNDITAHYNSVKGDVVIKTYLISGYESEYDSIQFKDPWVVDTNDSRFYTSPYGYHSLGMNAPFLSEPSPMQLTFSSKYQGVFLNQDPAQTSVFYSVHAPQTQVLLVNGKNITWYFQRWQGTGVEFRNVYNDTSDIVFKEPGAVAEAVYKGHLASSTTNALTFNNQRKMVFDGQTYHLVYEDNGEIYYTYSEDEGESWAKEIRLSDGGGGNKYPSICIDPANEELIIAVVWQRYLNPTGDIQLKCKTITGWQASKTVRPMMIAPADFQSTPVVEKGFWNNIFMIVWHDYDSKNLKVRAFNYISGAFGSLTDVPNTNAYSMYPSLSSDNYYRQHLAWEENGEIYYMKFYQYYGDKQEEYHWEISKENVSEGSGYSNHKLPSITTDYLKHPSIMWQAYSGPALETQIILHRKRVGGEWGSINSFIGKDEFHTPSITGYPNVQSNEKLKATWCLFPGYIWTASYDGEEWSAFSQWMSGLDATISANMSTYEISEIAFRSSGEDPYLIQTDFVTSSPLERSSNTSSIPFTHHRRGVLSLGKAEIAYELGEFTVNGNSINLYQYPDTISVGHNSRWEEIFRTEPFTVSGQTSLGFLQAFEILNRDSLMNTFPNKAKIEFRLEVVDAQSGQVLASPHVFVVSRNLPSNFRQVKNIVFNIPGSWNVYLRVGLQLPASLEFGQSMVEAYYIEDSGSKQGSLAKHAKQKELTPTQYQLFQNYPNPFNPETVIRFALPQQTNVKLTIYDVSGRQVKTLVNEQMAAGYHTAVWDGRNDNGVQVGTGVYFYHITAGDPSASLRTSFSQVRKMLLVR